jgi:hypothetical protein
VTHSFQRQAHLKYVREIKEEVMREIERKLKVLSTQLRMTKALQE